jgi:hypothetical protein
LFPPALSTVHRFRSPRLALLRLPALAAVSLVVLGLSAAALADPSSTPLATWPAVDGSVHAVAPDGSGGVYIGGQFASVGGFVRHDLAHVLADGSVDPNWSPDVDGDVRPIVATGSAVYVGGNFRFDLVNDSFLAGGLAIFDPSTGARLGVRSLFGEVDSLALAGPTLYVGRAFSTDPTPNPLRMNLVALDARTRAILLSFDADVLASGPGEAVLALPVSGSTLYAGGRFTTVNGSVTRNHLAAFDAATGAVTSWNPDVDGIVESVAIAGSTLYSGGSFTTVNGSTARSNAAAFDLSTGVATGWDPDVVGPAAPAALFGVFSVSVAGASVYVGGQFSAANSRRSTDRRRG